MRVATTEFTGRRGATIVQDLFLETFAWIPREIHDTDLGVDFDVEVVTEGQTRGRHLGVQVKSGPSWFDERSSAGWWFRFGDDHYQYWLHHDFPIIVVLVDLERRCAYWQQVTADTAVPAGENWKLEVPAAQVLDASARETLAGLADAPRVYGDAALTAFHDHLGHLPPEAVTALVRLHAQVPRTNLEARRPVERLTATLAGGRHDPDACCAVLLERTPNWLTGRTKTNPKWQGPDEREVWCAIGGYANEHELPARAADAFARAAAAGAQPPGHWQASAGIFEMNAGLPQAEQTLRAARDLEGGQILADIGLAILAHRGRPGPAEVPQSLSAHNIDAWRTSPTARMFLGDQCAARNDYDGALTHYEAALSRSPGSSAAQILIARALLARLNTHLSPGRDQDLRRVLQLASDARAARRCWDGPSETAAEVLMQARLLQADVEAALAVALPAPDGEATPREAAAASLTALAARGAYLAGQLDTGDALAAASAAASPLYTAQMAAFRAQASGAQAQELRRLWTTALDDAPSEDQRFIAIQYLAQAGQWPIPALEERRAAATIPPDVYAVLAAKAHTQLGDLPQAARTLRPLQHTSVLAVMELADILEQAGTPHEAATVLRQAADRFADLNLELKALDVLRRCGDDQALVQRALLLLARPGLPSTIRQRLRQHLLDHAYRMRDWAMAGEHAEMGLNDLLTANPDTDAPAFVRSNEAAQDFAWAKTGDLYNLRRWNEAWAVWERYQPQPVSTQQALIWLHLIRRHPWTERGVRALLDVRTRFADDDEVSSQVLDAINRALAVADDPAQPQWGAPWAQAPTADILHELRTLAGQAMDDHQARHPNGSLTTVVGVPDADTLKALHTTAAARSSTHRQVLQAIRDGDAVLGLAASTLNGLQ
ncbi:DUF4365 domain-containing protein (plasmid) [Streptomyces viridifaciens]|nr:DUF4365 domain-containing protein [Streptomyces viridifaciens]